MVHGPTGSGPTTPNYQLTITPAQAMPEFQEVENLLVWPDVEGCEGPEILDLECLRRIGCRKAV